MKTKRNILGALVAGTLLAASGSASATQVWSWTGTAAQWADPIAGVNGGTGGNAGVVYDGYTYTNDALPATAPNGGNAGTTAVPMTAAPDVTFTFGSNTIATNATTAVTLKEDHIGSDVFYNVHLSWGGASLSSGSFAYRMDTVDPKGFTAASLDSIVVAGLGDVTKKVYTDSTLSTLLLTLNSVNGARAPLAGWSTLLPVTLSGYTSLYIVDTINSGNVTDIFNELISIPEPATLALLGIGMLGVFGLRRKNAVEDSSSMTYC